MVGMPSLRTLPPALGISARRTGAGTNLRAFSCARSCSKKPFRAVGGFLDRAHRRPINPRRFGPPILPDPFPRRNQETRIRHEVKHIIKPTTTIGDRPTLQLGLHTQYPLQRRERTLQRGTDIHRRIF